MADPYSGVRATFPVKLEVISHSWRLLSSPRGCSAIQEVNWICSHGSCLLGPAPAEVSGAGLVLWRWFSFVDVTALLLLPWKSLTWAYSGRGRWFGPPPVEIAGLDLAPERLLTFTCSCGCQWLGPGPTEFAGSGLLPWGLLPHNCSSGGH